MSTTPKPIPEQGHTKVLLRKDVKPPTPVSVLPLKEEPWSFDPAPDHLLWAGEGARCEATFPPAGSERSVECELVDGHLEDWPHSAQRSSV